MAEVVENNAGGPAHIAPLRSILLRGLVFGSDKGTYYLSPEKQHETFEQFLLGLAESETKSKEALDIIVEADTRNLCKSRKYLHEALALFARKAAHPSVRTQAREAVVQLCRTLTDLAGFLNKYNSYSNASQKRRAEELHRKRKRAWLHKDEARKKRFGDEYREYTFEVRPDEIFVPISEVGRGWGRGLRRVMKKWFAQKRFLRGSGLAFMVTKYRQRDGWMWRDILRLAHIKPITSEQGTVFRFLTKDTIENVDVDSTRCPADVEPADPEAAVKLLEAFKELQAIDATIEVEADASSSAEEKKEVRERVKSDRMKGDCDDADSDNGAGTAVEASTTNLKKIVSSEDVERAINLIKKYRFGMEHLPNSLSTNVAVWKSILHHVPLMNLVRNMRRLLGWNIFDEPQYLDLVCRRFDDEEGIRRARLSPFHLLLAYAALRNEYYGGLYEYRTKIVDVEEEDASSSAPESNAKTLVVQRLLASVERAFYSTFESFPQLEGRVMFALDVSGSMDALCCGDVTCRDVAGAMLLVAAKQASNFSVTCFSEGIMDITERAKAATTLDAMFKLLASFSFSSTDCTLPLKYAAQQKEKYDAFIVITDNETYENNTAIGCPEEMNLPLTSKVMKVYRRIMDVPDSMLVTVGLTATEFSIADPMDALMADVVGMTPATPGEIVRFVNSRGYTKNFNATGAEVADDE